jgi:two-component system response regulator NreC
VNTLRILIVDDHSVVREGLRLIISHESNWEVCGLASNGSEAIEKAAELQPDIILLDLNMPDLSGLEVVREVRRRLPKVELVIFSAEQSEQLIEQLFDAGAKSFVRKVDPPELLIAAIKAAAQHRPYFTFESSQILFSRLLNKGDGHSSPRDGEKLTARERQIIRHVAEGKSNKESAATLGVSIRTIETHRASFMRKLGAYSTAAVVRYAIRNRLIEA